MKTTDILSNIDTLKYNPAGIQRNILEILKGITNGEIDIVDASNPFMFCLEASAVNTAGFIQHTEALNRRQYPASAITMDDLYLHMSDKDYIGRFALPDTAEFIINIQKEELLNAMVIDSATGINKVTLPRNTYFTIADTIFSLQYPVDIKKMSHGGLQIEYNTDISSPLYQLNTNIINFDEITDINKITYISFKLITHQFNIITRYNELNSAAGFTTNITITDQFYHCRVYVLNGNKWDELLTTHSDQIYNPNIPTAVIKVIDKDISVSIPTIYTNSNLIRGKLRIDVYQSKGNISLDMSNYKLNDFSANWLAIDSNDSSIHTSAVSDIKNMSFYSIDTSSNGRSALSIDELMKRVINNSVGVRNLPITNIQLENSILDTGYSFVKNIDSITNRVYLATKPMIEPTDSKLVTSASSGISRVSMLNTDLINGTGINKTDTSFIITPDALFTNNNGVIKIVDKTTFNQIQSMSNQLKVETINKSDYLYTPFHYVINTKNNKFSAKPYYLDNPSIISKSFIKENTDTEIQVNIGSNYKIEKNINGYKLIVKTNSNDLFKNLNDNEIYCQISFKATGQTTYSYLLGELAGIDSVSNERIYVFNLNTNFDINESNQIAQNSFRYSNVSISTYSDLLQDINIVFLTTVLENNNLTNSDVDVNIGRFQLPIPIVFLSYERIKVNFGYSLDYLWSRNKVISNSKSYLKYTENIYATCPEDVYEIDITTGSIFSIDNNGELVYNVLHTKGDIILDNQGNQLIKHHVGDIVLDEQGNAIEDTSNINNNIMYVDIVTIEGAYMFSTDVSSNIYKNKMVTTMVDWITKDLPRMNLSLLDQTKIFFYPKITHGYISCNIGNGGVTSIPAAQSFNVNLIVPKKTYDDVSLTEEISRITKQVINKQLDNSTVAISDIEYALKNKYGADVIDVSISGFGLNSEYNAITINDKSSKLSIRKKLVLLPDNSIILEEDVVINYNVYVTK